jgi:hypothetical protein
MKLTFRSADRAENGFMRRVEVGLLLVGLGLACAGCSSLPPVERIPRPQIGEPAPEIEGADLTGRHFKLSDYRGKVVLLDFWSIY